MGQKLKDKVAIVTGASKGIGAAIAERLAADGASVIVNYSSSKEGAEKVVANIVKKGGKAVAVQANVAEQKDIKRLFEESKKAFGKLDILINNAGIYKFIPLEEVTSEQFHKQFDLNVLGVLLTSQESLKYFGKDGGSIVNISSLASTAGLAQTSIYGATKAAVDSITRTLSKELGPRKIRVNSINPGLVETEGVTSAGFDKGEFHEHTKETTPLGRVGQPNDIAPAVAFLASDEASWITGESWVIARWLALKYVEIYRKEDDNQLLRKKNEHNFNRYLDTLLIGAFPAWPHSAGWGYGPSGILGTILVILLILALLGRI